MGTKVTEPDEIKSCLREKQGKASLSFLGGFGPFRRNCEEKLQTFVQMSRAYYFLISQKPHAYITS